MDRCSGNPSLLDETEIKNEPLADPIQRQQRAETIIKKLVCDQLYYPNTYDPVSTKVDSAFFCPIIDGECVSAAYEIIKMQAEYESEKVRMNRMIGQYAFMETLLVLSWKMKEKQERKVLRRWQN